MNKESVFLIPIYNEKPLVIISVLEDILSNTNSNIIVYNDGSKNGIDIILNRYLKTVDSSRLKVISNRINHGQGYALRKLAKAAIKLGYKYYITFDADGQHRVQDAMKLLNHIKSEDIDIVLGKRNIKIDNMPIGRRILLRLGKTFLNNILNFKFQDPQNGLRVMNKYAIKDILSNLSIHRFGHATEILDRIHNNKNITYQELDIKVIYNEYTISKGQKNINIFNILIEYITYKMKNNRLNINIYNYLHNILKLI